MHVAALGTDHLNDVHDHCCALVQGEFLRLEADPSTQQSFYSLPLPLMQRVVMSGMKYVHLLILVAVSSSLVCASLFHA